MFIFLRFNKTQKNCIYFQQVYYLKLCLPFEIKLQENKTKNEKIRILIPFSIICTYIQYYKVHLLTIKFKLFYNKFIEKGQRQPN